MTEIVPVITIDGPSGSGKGTVSRRIARQLGWQFLDSGALYRLTALYAVRKGVDFADEAAVAELARTLPVRFEEGDDEPRVLLDGEEVSGEIRSETAGNNASKVAAIPAVREALLERQRAFCEVPGLVADGRDMGTVVFPDAPAKIFLTASAEERAQRRYKQLIEKGMGANLADLVQEIEERDRRDASRPVAPLKPAEDALLLDSTGLSIDEVVAQAMAWVSERTAIA
ncbi:(d)CMP kinase [Endothiovibrio diazotrophicus]